MNNTDEPMPTKMSNFRIVRNSFLIIISMVFFVGCSPSAHPETSTQVDIGAIQTSAISTFAADLTSSAPTVTIIPTVTQTFTPLPSLTPLPTATPIATFTSVPTSNPYLILDATTMDLLKTNIPFYVVDWVSDDPCVYYLQPVLTYPLLPRTGNMEADVTTALNNLFSIKDKTIGRFFNPFSASGHTLVSIDMKDSPLMRIDITGWPGRTENVCTNHAMRDQLFKTIYAISIPFGINDVVIWQDGFLYDDYMIGG